MEPEAMSLAVMLTVEQAGALAQFTKRVGHSDCERLATRHAEGEAYEMRDALDRIRDALAAAGFAPRQLPIALHEIAYERSSPTGIEPRRTRRSTKPRRGS